ncbi:MAG: hypothetical protein RSB35_08195, partial [Eubacterium sp.]
STGTAYWPTRVALDINEKYNTYDSVTIKGCTFTNIQGTPGTPSQEGQSGYGAALAVKARNDGNYTDPAAALKNVTITGNTFTGNTCDLMLGEPQKDGLVDSKTYNLGTLKVEGNAFSAKVQNNYSDLMDIAKNYWGSTTPDFAALVAGNLNIYQYYIDSTMKTLYAPIELNHAGDITYYGDIAKAYEAVDEGDTITVNQPADPGVNTVTLNDVNMNAKPVNLKLKGNTIFTGTFSGSTLVDLILSNGITVDFTGANVSNIAKVAVDGFNAAEPTQIQAASTVKQTAFMTESGTLNFASGDVNTWTFVNPSDQFNGGEGTQEKPWQINTPDQLNILKKMEEQQELTKDKYFVLTNDITVASWTALAKFDGHLDADGHTITATSGNSFITELSSGASIKNLHFEGFTDNLVAVSSGTVENCFTLGNGSSDGKPIIGHLTGGALRSSYTTGSSIITTRDSSTTTASIVVENAYYCSDAAIAGQAGTAIAKADMQKARFAIVLNGGNAASGQQTVGAWYFAQNSAYPYVQQAADAKVITPLIITITSSDMAMGTAAMTTEPPVWAGDTVGVKATVTNTATTVFENWYVDDVKQERATATASFRVMKDTAIKAQFAEKAKTKLTISVNGLGSIFGADGALITKTGKTIEGYVGSTIKLTAIPRNLQGNVFSYWLNPNTQSILSEEAAYTYTFGSADGNVNAVFYLPEEDSHQVVFRDLNNRIIQTSEYTEGQTLTPPTPPIFDNYTFDHWVDTKGNTVDSTTVVTEDMDIKAVYTKNVEKVQLTVTGGTISGESTTTVEVEKAKSVSIIANAPESGKYFVGWYKTGDTQQTIISTEATYRFYIYENTNLTAKYGEVKPETVPNVTFSNSNVIKQSDGTYLFIIVGKINDYAGTPVSYGFVYKNGADVDVKDLYIGAKGTTAYGSSKLFPTREFNMGLYNKAAGDSMSYRCYMTYEEDGQQITVYSNDVFTLTAPVPEG